jgi:hypothetical protein
MFGPAQSAAGHQEFPVFLADSIGNAYHARRVLEQSDTYEVDRMRARQRDVDACMCFNPSSNLYRVAGAEIDSI